MQNSKSQNFRIPYKSFEKSPSDLLSSLNNRNSQPKSKKLNNLGNVLNIDLGLLECTLLMSKNRLQQSDKTKKESEEDLQHSYSVLKNFFYSPSTKSIENGSFWQDFREKSQEVSIQEIVKNQHYKNTVQRESIYKKMQTDWESKQRRIVSAAELNQYQSYNSNSQLSYKSILFKSNKSIDEKKLKYILVVQKYISRRPINYQNYEMYNMDYQNNGNGQGMSYFEQENNYGDINYDSMLLGGQNQKSNSQAQPSQSHKQLLDNFAKDVIDIQGPGDDVKSVWKFQIEHTKQFDSNIQQSCQNKHEEEFTYELSNTQVKSSCTYLEEEFFEMVKAKCCRSKLTFINSHKFSESANQIYGYVEDVILNFEFIQEFFVEKDDNDIPIWAILFYCVRAGQIELAQNIARSYTGSLEQEVNEIVNYLNFDFIDSAVDNNRRNDMVSLFDFEI